MVQWGYFPGSAKGSKGLLLRILGHPHPNGRMRANYVRKFVEPKKKTLDVGCGEGIFYYGLTKKGCEMFGIDYSFEALENMRKRLKLVSISPKIANADAQMLPIKSGIFEQAICLDVIEHLRDANSAIKGIARVLKKGGILVLNITKKPRRQDEAFLLRWSRDRHPRDGVITRYRVPTALATRVRRV